MPKVYLVEQRKNMELNLENLDEEMRMEKVRQAAAKMEWASFGQAVRKNLLEKRNTIDADGRIDVLKALAYMKTRMPIESHLPLAEKIRIFTESLGGTFEKTDHGWNVMKPHDLSMNLSVENDKVTNIIISFWESQMFVSVEALTLVREEKWTEFRDIIAKILSKYDKDLSREDRLSCQSSWAMLEKFFERYSTDSTYTAIQDTNYGYYLKPADLRQGRLYYMVDPLYRNICRKDGVSALREEDYDNLPYIEFSFVKHDSKCTLPEYNAELEWSETVEADAAICLKFPKGILISEATRKKMAKFCAKSATIRHYTNSYRYALGEAQIEKDQHMITQFTDGKAQHFYEINVRSFMNEGDSVITEVYLKHLQDFHLVIAILRNEAKHMTFWESMLAACYELQGRADTIVPAIRMFVSLKRHLISISFSTKYGPIKVNIKDSDTLETTVEVVKAFTGEPVFGERVCEMLSRKLNETWSIPYMLTLVVSGEDCLLEAIAVPLRKENSETKGSRPTRGDFKPKNHNK